MGVLRVLGVFGVFMVYRVFGVYMLDQKPAENLSRRALPVASLNVEGLTRTSSLEP